MHACCMRERERENNNHMCTIVHGDGVSFKIYSCGAFKCDDDDVHVIFFLIVSV